MGKTICRVIGSKKNHEVKKIIRYFKERSLQYQFVDILQYPLSPGEFQTICAVLNPEDLIDEKSTIYTKRGYAYMDYDPVEELMEYPQLLKIPIVRLGRRVLLQPGIKELDSLLASE